MPKAFKIHIQNDPSRNDPTSKRPIMKQLTHKTTQTHNDPRHKMAKAQNDPWHKTNHNTKIHRISICTLSAGYKYCLQVRNAELLSPILVIILVTRCFISVLTRNKFVNVAHTMYSIVKFVNTKLLEYILG